MKRREMIIGIILLCSVLVVGCGRDAGVKRYLPESDQAQVVTPEAEPIPDPVEEKMPEEKAEEKDPVEDEVPVKEPVDVPTEEEVADESLIDDFNDGDLGWYTWDVDGWSEVSIAMREECGSSIKYMRAVISGVNDYVDAPRYPGGFGVYVGKAVTSDQYLCFKYRNPKLMGSHLGSDHFRFQNALEAYLQVQLIDDDNGNYDAEADTSEGYVFTQDDQFIFAGYQYVDLDDPEYDDKIDHTFEEWGEVAIPLSKFVDINPGAGDDVFNPDQSSGSGGLLTVQFDFIRGKYPITYELVDIDDVRIIPQDQVPAEALVF